MKTKRKPMTEPRRAKAAKASSPKAKPSKKAAQPLDAATLNKIAYALVCDMEDDVTAAEQFADAVAFIAQTLDDHEGCVVQRLAWTIKDRIESIGELRGKLFRVLHPNRPELEKTGWPSDTKGAL
jgi:hypothetical protein